MTEVGTGVAIGRATRDDVPALAGTLAAAFQDDPVMRWWIGDGAERAAILPRFFGFAVEHQYLRYEEVHVADRADGVAAWCPPGRWRPPEDELAALAPGYFESIGEHHFARGAFIGVRPDRQGNGIGSALLAHMEARLDAEGLPAYLEASSERNRALYVRHGFDVTGEVRLPDGPPMWLMWREPKEA